MIQKIGPNQTVNIALKWVSDMNNQKMARAEPKKGAGETGAF